MEPVASLHVERLLPDYLTEALPPDQARAVSVHLDQCTACQEEYEAHLRAWLLTDDERPMSSGVRPALLMLAAAAALLVVLLAPRAEVLIVRLGSGSGPESAATEPVLRVYAATETGKQLQPSGVIPTSADLTASAPHSMLYGISKAGITPLVREEDWWTWHHFHEQGEGWVLAVPARHPLPPLSPGHWREALEAAGVPYSAAPVSSAP